MKVGRADEIRPGGIKAPAAGVRRAALYPGKAKAGPPLPGHLSQGAERTGAGMHYREWS